MTPFHVSLESWSSSEITKMACFRAMTIDGMCLRPISNAYMLRLSTLHRDATIRLLPRKNLASDFHGGISTCSSVAVAPASPLGISHSSLALNAQVSPANTVQRSEEWLALRKDKLTTSTFSTAMGFWRGTRRAELWSEKVFASDTKIIEASGLRAMDWGVVNEAAAIEKYNSITGRDVSYLGFAVHSEPRLDWLGASPDGLLSCSPNAGILEVKCPINKGKPDLAFPWLTMPFYYMPQIQGLMEIMDREWVDLYCWTPNGSTIFRICRERRYWKLIHGILHEFWWKHVIPAREALLVGGEEAANFYKPTSEHKQTGLAISKSKKIASQAKLLCKEIGDHVEFYA